MHYLTSRPLSHLLKYIRYYILTKNINFAILPLLFASLAKMSKQAHWVPNARDRYYKEESEAECLSAKQERWEVADDLDAEREVRDLIDDRPEDWAVFERDIEQAQYNLDGLLPE